MGEVTGIEWTDHTLNPWIGCARVSPGCDNCYAEVSARRLGAQHGLKLWSGDRYLTKNWKREAERWNRLALAAKKRSRVFCASHADVFEMIGNADLTARRHALWELIEATPSLDWLLLTKRPENVDLLVPSAWRSALPRNIWLGATVENQEMANKRLPILASIPAACRFISIEPLLERVSVRSASDGVFHWLIVGGESGGAARPFSLSWIAPLVAEAKEIGAAFFLKQLGVRPVAADGTPIALGARKGGDPAEWPALGINPRREFPGPFLPA